MMPTFDMIISFYATIIKHILEHTFIIKEPSKGSKGFVKALLTVFFCFWAILSFLPVSAVFLLSYS